MPSAGRPPDATVQQAIQEIGTVFGPPVSVSRLYRTPCFPPGAGPDYVNAALRIETGRRPAEILAELHAIEMRHGRERVKRWGMRTLDIDLIAYGAAVLPDLATYSTWAALPPDLQQMRAPDQLVLPHPRLQDRSFVLVPLADVAPDWRHPVLGLWWQRCWLRAPPQSGPRWWPCAWIE
jgi:2-amino-4-hydroxy-6-hydroxymethyldihydropteridine diphosphokinase